MADSNAVYVHVQVKLKAMCLLTHACLTPIQIKYTIVNVIKAIQDHFVKDVLLAIMAIQPNQVEINSFRIVNKIKKLK